MQIRELRGREKQEIRRVVSSLCANYDAEYGCLPLDSGCFMFGKTYTNGALCKWFRNALMPQSPEMERIFSGGIARETKPCAVCGKEFTPNGRQTYCSEKCAATGRKESAAKNSRDYRKRRRDASAIRLQETP